MFSGSFTQISFGEVLRLLTAASQSGELEIIYRGQPTGSVSMVNGQIAHAKTQSYESLDALSELCAYVEGDFSFSPGQKASGQTLLNIPTSKIIETVVGRVNQINIMRSYAPLPNEVVVYKPSENLSHLEATPDELTLLLLSNGIRTIDQIALESGKTVDFVQQCFARFRQAGILDLVNRAPAPEPPSVIPEPTPPPAIIEDSPLPPQPDIPPAPKTEPRYWRGKRIE